MTSDTEPAAVIEKVVSILKQGWDGHLTAFRVQKRDYPWIEKWDSVLVNIDGVTPAFYRIVQVERRRIKGIDYFDVFVQHEFDVIGYNGKDKNVEPSPSVSASASPSPSASPSAKARGELKCRNCILFTKTEPRG